MMSPTLSSEGGHLVILGTLVDTKPTFGSGLRICKNAIMVIDIHSGLIVEKIEDEDSKLQATENGIHGNSDNDNKERDSDNHICNREKTLQLIIEKYNAVSALRLEESEFLMPGFIDCHTHAPQFPNAGHYHKLKRCNHSVPCLFKHIAEGLGLDLPLLEWLEKYTFPLEAQFSESEYAQSIFEKLVSSTLAFGSTTVAYFTSIHLDATLALCDTINRLGQRAVVGKCCMDRNPSSEYVESTSLSLEWTRIFLKKLSLNSYPLIKPCVMPRFVPACTPALLQGLGDIVASSECGLRVTSHISENLEEIKLVKQLEPQCKSYAHVYDKHGLLTPFTFLAHGVHLSDVELELLAQRGTGIAHCPNSNNSIRSGNFNAKRAINEFGVKVGLATDCSAGYSISMINAMQNCLSTSNVLDSKWCLSVPEALFLATRGSAQVLNMDQELGALEVGMKFDALRIDMSQQPLTAPLGFESVDQLVEKFVRLADDRNIVQVFVNGKTIKKSK